MSKRPLVDLAALTSDAAAPMPEAAQRAAPRLVKTEAPPSPAPPPVTRPAKADAAPERTPTANLQGLAFKVSPAFRKRFKKRAVEADLKLNELLFAALDAWEEKSGLKK